MAQYIKTEDGYKEFSIVTDDKMDKTNPTGTGSFSMNRKAGTVIGTNSHAEGNDTTASRAYSHAEGDSTQANGIVSHAEGSYTKASGDDSHAEGYWTTASGSDSHAEGIFTTASGKNSHAEGNHTTASGDHSHAEGYSTSAFLSAVTTTNPTSQDIITAWKTKKFSVAKGNYSHVEGKDNLALYSYSHAEGNGTIADGPSSHAEGDGTIANGPSSHAEGYQTTASQSYSHAEGIKTTASGISSHAEGGSTIAEGQASHAEGGGTTANGYMSHAEGFNTTASGYYSHAEGIDTTASGVTTHAEGSRTKTSGESSHAEGGGTIASGNYSHAEGYLTTASGNYSHAEGSYTRANGEGSHVQGKYNIEDTSSIYADIIGNGTSDTARSNATTVDWNGNAWFAGDVYTGSTSGTNKDEGSKKLATEEYVNNSIAAGGTDISLGLTSAAVGQIIKVKAIDASGKPTAWEAADMAGGGGEEDFELIFSDTITEDAREFVRTVDKDGNTFELKEAVVIVYTVPFESSTSNVGRAVGFLPSASWGHNLAAGISNSIPAGTSSIARYDVIHVKVVQGYQCLINRWESQNTTNVRGIMMRNNTAGQVPINFKFGDDVTAIGELSNTKGNMTCLKIVSYGTCMAKGDVVILYGKRV